MTWPAGLAIGLAIVSLLGCASQKPSIKTAQGLPDAELAYYCDTFDKFRNDIWEKSGYVFSHTQFQNIKMASMKIEEGRLQIQTKTGSFSKGSFATKYTFKGDFDCQIDCHIDFIEEQLNMDQLLSIVVMEESQDMQNTFAFVLGLVRRGESRQNFIYSGYHRGGKYHPGAARKIDNFSGTLRIVRSKNKISTFYKTQSMAQWKKLSDFPANQNAAVFGFGLQNFIKNRNSISAETAIVGWFDNFKINYAREIIEAEI